MEGKMELLKWVLISPANIKEIADEISKMLGKHPATIRVEYWNHQSPVFHLDKTQIRVEAKLPEERGCGLTNSAVMIILFNDVVFGLETRNDPMIFWTHPQSFSIRVREKTDGDYDVEAMTITMVIPEQE